MPANFETHSQNDGFTLKLYRGEGMAMLAFDLAEEVVNKNFVGFAVDNGLCSQNKFLLDKHQKACPPSLGQKGGGVSNKIHFW